MKWFATVSGAVALAGSAAAASASLVPIDELVNHALTTNQAADIFVQFRPRAAADEAELAPLSHVDRLRRIHRELVELAMVTQGDLLANLQSRGFDAKMMWINNSLFIRGATPELIRELRQLQNAIEIYGDDEVARLDEPIMTPEGHALVDNNVNSDWNIQLIGAPSVWSSFTRGEGVTLANIDSGVRFTHQALVGSYRGNQNGQFNHDYNWFDPRQVNPFPYDNNGHGTHVMGTAAGSEASGIGVAPGVKWIAARGCVDSACFTSDLMGSFQYLLAPTPQGRYNDPTAGDVTKAPAVINNSWGGGRGSTTFLSYIRPHIEAGTVVVFSQGNSGPNCATANSPGDLFNVIGVASTDINDRLSSFSSRGPGIGNANFPLQKPDISAPGQSIRSAFPSADNAYALLSGTSMAAPHVSALVALMRSVNPNISVASIRQIINNTARRNLGVPNGGATRCARVAYNRYPNYHYGFGRIDALEAVKAARALLEEEKA